MTRAEAIKKLYDICFKNFPPLGEWKCPTCQATGMCVDSTDHFDILTQGSGATMATDGWCAKFRTASLSIPGVTIIREAGPICDLDQDPVTTYRIEAFKWISGLVGWSLGCYDCKGPISSSTPWEHYDIWRDVAGHRHYKCCTRRAYIGSSGGATLDREAGPMTKLDSVQPVEPTVATKKKLSDWPHVCSGCGGPGIEMFNTFQCYQKCKAPMRMNYKIDGIRRRP